MALPERLSVRLGLWGPGALPAMPRPTHSKPRTGMHWVRDEGFQQMWANAREKRAQPLCPLCREPVLFARLWKRT